MKLSSWSGMYRVPALLTVILKRKVQRLVKMFAVRSHYFEIESKKCCQKILWCRKRGICGKRVMVAHSGCVLCLKRVMTVRLNKAKWFAKQLASLVYQCKAKVLEFPSKKSDTLSETIPKNILSPRPNLT